MKNSKNGITLIALVITIIVLLILAGISISLVTGKNGVLIRAKDANNAYSMSSAKEQANMRAAGYVSEYMEKVYVSNDMAVGAMTAGEYVLSQIDGKEDGDYRYSVSGSTITVTSKTTGEALAIGTVRDDGGISWSDSVASGESSIGNHENNSNTVNNQNTNTNDQNNTITEPNIEIGTPEVGDFVNYSAGNWTQAEINAIGDVYSGKSLPSQVGKFGGFQAGDSKDESITPYRNYANTYSGWKVLSLNEDGTVKQIIHAGTTEGFYYSSAWGADATRSASLAVAKFRNRNWNVYATGTYGASGEIAMKYSSIPTELRATGAYYWIISITTPYYISPDGNYYQHYASAQQDYRNPPICYGLRPIVTMEEGVNVYSASPLHTTHTTPETAWNLIGNENTNTGNNNTNTTNNENTNTGNNNTTAVGSAPVVAASPNTYYGKTVNYSKKIRTSTGNNQSPSVDGKWKIFYSDGTNIFIIPDGYLATTPGSGYIGLPTTYAGMTKSNSYGAYWITAPTTAHTPRLAINSWNRWTDYSSYDNAKCASTLLTTSNWSSFTDSNYADYTIGSPTLKMFCESWNALGTSNLICENSNSYGYYMGTNDYYSDVSNDSRYNNSLYFPAKSGVSSCYGYWLATPSARLQNIMMYVYCDGHIGVDSAGSTDVIGVRPIVCLKSGVKLTQGTGDYDYTLSFD